MPKTPVFKIVRIAPDRLLPSNNFWPQLASTSYTFFKARLRQPFWNRFPSEEVCRIWVVDMAADVTEIEVVVAWPVEIAIAIGDGHPDRMSESPWPSKTLTDRVWVALHFGLTLRGGGFCDREFLGPSAELRKLPIPSRVL